MPLKDGATNEILPFAHSSLESAGDILSQDAYEADVQRLRGNQAGIARRALVNKAMRQMSLIAAGLAQFLANNYPDGIQDNGDLDQIEAGMKAAIMAIVSDNLPEVISLSDAVDSERSDVAASSRAVKTAYDRAAAAALTAAWGSLTGKPTSFPAAAHAATHATGGADAITPNAIGITWGTEELTSGVSPLATGTIYIQYE